jgi:hypothetical protein
MRDGVERTSRLLGTDFCTAPIFRPDKVDDSGLNDQRFIVWHMARRKEN